MTAPTRARALVATLVVLVAGCQDLGPPRREHAPPAPDADTPPPRGTAISVHCGRATVALSPDLRAAATLRGARVLDQGDGRMELQGDARLALAELEVRCDTLEVTPCEGTNRFLLLATGDIELRRGNTTLCGRTLVIDGDAIDVAGNPRLDVAWRMDAATR